MKKEGFYAKRIYPLVFMLIVTIVCISIVSGLYLFTVDRVKANEKLFLRKTVLQAAGFDVPTDYIAATKLFEERVTTGEGWYAIEMDDGSFIYAAPFSGPGLWGKIDVMVGFRDADESSTGTYSLTGIGIISQNETPGLGARIEEPWFTGQFDGKWGPFRLVDEGTASRTDEIDGITGATRTSASMLSIMNRAVTEGPAIVQDAAKGE